MIIRKLYTFPTLFKETPKNLKGKKLSSQNWIVRQIRDPYVEMAKQRNYRCRSAFKLLEINNKYKIFKPGLHVIDCGAAPGSWTQVAVQLTNADEKTIDERVGCVIAIDKLPLYPIDGAMTFGNLDFTSEKTQQILITALNGKFADVVLSDMAPNATGLKDMDHENIIRLAYTAFKFALESSCYDATFVTKVWDGTLSKNLENDIGKYYKTVKIVRPDATRDESSEKFILARGFKGIRVRS